MLTLRNNNGVTKEVKQGFSWTVFFFGFFVPIFRADWKFAVIMFLASIAGSMVIPGLGSWVIMIIFMFKYNEWYINDLKAQGYRIVNN